MIRIRRGQITEITSRRDGVTEAVATVDGKKRQVVNYDFLTGPVQPGVFVVLNTTAVELGLGTGGFDFVIHVEGQDSLDAAPQGHIMKLRYTPFQVKMLSVEEPDSPYHEQMSEAADLCGLPVMIGSLHSMIGPASVAFKEMSGGIKRLVYIMTDGAALPLPFSRLVRDLKSRNMIDLTITAGHAFGGDLEAVSIYSALLAAVAVGRADAAIVCMGPGVVGTHTTFGSTALEVGPIIDAVTVLGGSPIVIPRISFADERERHRGISHHTLTALGRIALSKAVVAIPKLPEGQMTEIFSQLACAGIDKRHRMVVTNADFVISAMEKRGIKVTSMGRTVSEDPAFFLAAAAAGSIAAIHHSDNAWGEPGEGNP